MGADLTIRNVHLEARAKWSTVFNDAVIRRDSLLPDHPGLADDVQKEVDEAYDKMYGEDVYFRDSYNVTGLASRLRINWSLFVTEGALNIDPFLVHVRRAKMEPVTKDELIRRRAGDYDVQSWQRYFVEKRLRLIKFCEHALAIGSPIDVSY